MAVIQKTIITIFLDVQNSFSRIIAQKISKRLMPKRFNVIVGEAVSPYALYNAIEERNPSMTIKLDILQNKGKLTSAVRPCRVEHCTGKPCRDTTESREAARQLAHCLKLRGWKALTGGNDEILFDSIKSFPWFWESETPYVSLTASTKNGNEAELADAISDGISAYFRR